MAADHPSATGEVVAAVAADPAGAEERAPAGVAERDPAVVEAHAQAVAGPRGQAADLTDPPVAAAIAPTSTDLPWGIREAAGTVRTSAVDPDLETFDPIDPRAIDRQLQRVLAAATDHL